MIVAAGLIVGGLQVVPAGAVPAGTWAVDGTATVSYRYEGHRFRVVQSFATRIVVNDDGTIDGEVTEPPCGAPGDPVTFTARSGGTGRAGIAAALRAFATRCYGTQSRLRGVRAGVRLSDDATTFSGRFRAHLRIPFVDDGHVEQLTVRVRGIVAGRRDE
jgi:hypothetical protein